MSDRSASIQPTHRFLFKPIEISDKGGCHLDVWIPGHAGDGNGVKDVVQEVKAGDRVPMGEASSDLSMSRRGNDDGSRGSNH